MSVASVLQPVASWLTVYGLSVTVFLSLFVGSFVFWRGLKEDYADDSLLSFSLVIFLLALLGLVVLRELPWHVLSPFWGSLLVASLGIWFLVRHYQWRLWDVWDSLISSFLWVMAILGLGLMSDGYLVLGYVISVLGLSSLVLGKWIFARYRGWRWYLSGKIGAIGLLELLFFTGVFFLVASLTWKRLYWSPFLSDLAMVGVCFLFLLVALYRRSGRQLREDIRWLKRK